MKRFVIALLALMLAGSFAYADIEKSFTIDTDELTVTNLVGEVEVVQGSGSDFRIRVTVMGEDAAEGLLDFATQDGGDGRLAVIFPVDDEDDYVYPRLGRHSKSTIRYPEGQGEEKSWLKKVFSGMTGKKVTVRGHGKGLEVWADLVIEVPEGRSLKVKQGVGTITASEVEGDLNLDISSGGIRAEDIDGELIVDTGSGSVEVARVKGELSVDTGSGSIEVESCQARKVNLDTGSGSVKATNLDCDYLNIDTGSGRVRAGGVTTDKVRIDTGSGSVKLQLDSMGGGDFVIDTGSGSIELELPADASADIVADTGSGGIHNKVSGAHVNRKARDELAMVVGDGEARVRLDAGSGSITILQK